MNAATLTSIRARHHEGPDGDRVFVLACQLGHCGEAARFAYEAAAREVSAHDRLESRLGGHHADARIADRLIELIDLTDPGTAHTAAAVDPATLAQLHDDLVPRPGGASAFVNTCVDGLYGDIVARAAATVLDELDGAAAGADLELVAGQVLRLATKSGEVAAA